MKTNINQELENMRQKHNISILDYITLGDITKVNKDIKDKLKLLLNSE